jgi:gluconokinase
MIVVLMGVAGSGKTAVGRLLAADLGWRYVDADDYHPAANVDKMRSGTPLNDSDRWPWLDRINMLLREQHVSGANTVLGCSALKAAYRLRIGAGLDDVRWVHLKGDFELIESRLKQRQGHYMPASLLRSQFETLEQPRSAFVVDVTPEPAQIARQIVAWLAQPRNAFTTASVDRDSRN